MTDPVQNRLHLLCSGVIVGADEVNQGFEWGIVTVLALIVKPLVTGCDKSMLDYILEYTGDIFSLVCYSGLQTLAF